MARLGDSGCGTRRRWVLGRPDGIDTQRVFDAVGHRVHPLLVRAVGVYAIAYWPVHSRWRRLPTTAAARGQVEVQRIVAVDAGVIPVAENWR